MRVRGARPAYLLDWLGGWMAALHIMHRRIVRLCSCSARPVPFLPGWLPGCPSAGDQYTGTSWDSYYIRQGNFSVAGLLNSIGFDAMVRGRPALAGWLAGWLAARLAGRPAVMCR